MKFCYDCGQAITHVTPEGVPNCHTCGPRWLAARNSPNCDVIVLDDDNRVLLMLRAKQPFNGLWGIPGGYVNHGEHPTDAAIREAYEETGIKIDVTGLMGIYLERMPDGEYRQSVCYVGVPRFYPKLSWIQNHDETQEVGFFDFNALPTNLVPFHQRRLHDLLSGECLPFEPHVFS